MAELLYTCPDAITVFLRYRLACAGCVVSAFEQVRDVPKIYSLDPGSFLAELERAVVAAEEPARG